MDVKFLVIIASAALAAVTNGLPVDTRNQANQNIVSGVFIPTEILKGLQENVNQNRDNADIRVENQPNSGEINSEPVSNVNLHEGQNQQLLVANQQPTLSNQQPILPNQQFMLSNPQPMLANQQSMLAIQQPILANQQSMLSYQQPMVAKPQQVLMNQQPILTNQQPNLSNQQIPSHVVANQPSFLITQQRLPNQQALLNSQQPALSVQQTVLANQQPGYSNQQPILVNQQPGFTNAQPILLNQQPGFSNQQAILLNQQPGLSNQQPNSAIVLQNGQIAKIATVNGQPALVALNSGNQKTLGTIQNRVSTLYAVVPVNGQNNVALSANGNTFLMPVQQVHSSPIYTVTTKK